MGGSSAVVFAAGVVASFGTLTSAVIADRIDDGCGLIGAGSTTGSWNGFVAVLVPVDDTGCTGAAVSVSDMAALVVDVDCVN